MKISGFTMVRNALKLYYPIGQSIRSILPIVDEFVVALGDCDLDDRTQEEIDAIGSNKIRVINTVWDLERYPNGTENAHQTDVAKAACSGDWLFYLQADEVVHEDDVHIIESRCRELLEDREVEGLLFRYLHFWGDYYHYHRSHGWYPHEIRIVRNDPDIHSWESAQSFRRIPGFDGRNYRQQEGTYKLSVASVDARIFHYGWVRPPYTMQNKNRALDTIHKGKAQAEELYRDREKQFDYGPLGLLTRFEGTHPGVMNERIADFDWGGELNYGKRDRQTNRSKQKHERLKYRLLTALEQGVLGGRQIGGFHNYVLLNR
ncbi:MAG: hypothetical protein J4G05_00280 [Chlorobi bacterium]|nr:hypothetical protein [Chlorobiota bacterium]